MKRRLPLDLDRLRGLKPAMLICMLGLMALGVLFVYSACSIREEFALQQLYRQQAELAAAGLVLCLVLAYLDYRMLLRLSWPLYLASLALLAAVLVAGEERMGARRSILGVQPAEFAKVTTVLVLAQTLGRPWARGWVFFLLALLLAALPMALVLRQPDLGTALVFLPMALAILLVAGTAPRALLTAVAAGTLIVGTMLGSLLLLDRKDLPPAWRRPLERVPALLDDYQRQRLVVYLFPSRSPHGMAWNKRQSEIAVGSGGMWGKGFLKGNQNLLGYLPQKVSANDFIFSVLAEETGFAGSLAVLVLFAGILFPGLSAAAACQDGRGRLLAVGLLALVFAHVFVNVAMTIGLVPVTGVPLPFISYGRSFLLAMIVSLGLVQSVAVHGQRSEAD